MLAKMNKTHNKLKLIRLNLTGMTMIMETKAKLNYKYIFSISQRKPESSEKNA
jgi:hypothetical protein